MLLRNLSSYIKKNVNYINTLYLKGKIRFGNFLVSVNNAIFFCEILECKRIIIEHSNDIFIRHKLLNQKYNMTIEPYNKSETIINNVTEVKINFFFYYHKFIKTELRLNLLENEILSYIPKFQAKTNDLYIHIRSGDIFQYQIPHYPQPPLCFYEKILDNFNFTNVIIISENDKNPVINELLRKYKNIIYKKNPLIIDFSYLLNSYNIVSSVSSFVINIIKFNNKLKYFWEYDIYWQTEKYFHLHYSVYDFPIHYIVYKMMPSRHYKKLMIPWMISKEQISLMLKEKCFNKFIVKYPNGLKNSKNIKLFSFI